MSKDCVETFFVINKLLNKIVFRKRYIKLILKLWYLFEREDRINLDYTGIGKQFTFKDRNPIGIVIKFQTHFDRFDSILDPARIYTVISCLEILT